MVAEDSTSTWERRTLTKTAFALAIAVTLLTGVILTLFDRRLTTGSVLSAVGLNLVASVIFAFFFSWLSGSIQERALLANLRDQYQQATRDQQTAIEKLVEKIDALTGDLVGKLAGFQQLYMPDRTYSASSKPDPAFNDDITASLGEAFHYLFRGTSAKFVPLRLSKADPGSLNTVEILTLDPRSDKVLHARAVERAQQRQADNAPARSVDAIVEDIRQEILMSLVALYEQRHICPIKVAFAQEPSATRLEVFDDAVYLSWYQGPNSRKLPFPETFRFPRGSFLYDIYAREVRRRLEIAENTLEFRQHTTDAQLRVLLEAVAERSISSIDINAWKEKYAEFVRSVERDLDR